jgi:hypothetical protein
MFFYGFMAIVLLGGAKASRPAFTSGFIRCNPATPLLFEG